MFRQNIGLRLLKQSRLTMPKPLTSHSMITVRSFQTQTPKFKLFKSQPQQPHQQQQQVAHPNEKDFQTHPILKRIPKFLRSYASKFINAPISHLISFVILHEITAIVPLVSLWYFFHQHPNYVPLEIPTWAIDQGAKVIDYVLSKMTDWEINSKQKMSMIIEGAYAFSIIKFLLPVRIVVSLYLMPWFAKWFVVPISNIFGNIKKIANHKKQLKQKDSFNDEVKTKTINKPRL